MIETEHNDALINRLLVLWSKIIEKNPDKDLDSDFFIECEYSTYKAPQWNAIFQDKSVIQYSESFATFNKAQEALIEFLVESCAREIAAFGDPNSANFDEDFVIQKTSELERIVIDQHYIAEKE